MCDVQDAVLMLSSVNLTGGVQRRRTAEDQLQMRSYFQENDLISVRAGSAAHSAALFVAVIHDAIHRLMYIRSMLMVQSHCTRVR